MLMFEGEVAHNFVVHVGCSTFHPAKFEQTITHQRVLLRR